MKVKRVRFPSLVILGVAVLMYIPAMTAGWFYTGALQRQALRFEEADLRYRGDLVGSLSMRRLHTLWQTVSTYAKETNLDSVQAARQRCDILAEVDERIAWLGIADAQGRVVAASRGMAEGLDVSDRQWFRRGLVGPYAGDVREAPLLEKYLPKSDGPRRFIDFAAPLRGPDGTVIGVVGMLVRWDWMREQLEGMSTRHAEVLLISKDRRVLFGPAALEGTRLEIGAAVVGSQAGSVLRSERWPDGRTYMTAAVPVGSYRDVPPFGWSVIVRQELDEASAPLRELTRTFWSVSLLAGVSSLLALWFFVKWLEKPIIRQTAFAVSLSEENADSPPYEETRFQEAADLSAALVRLQTRLRSGK